MTEKNRNDKDLKRSISDDFYNNQFMINWAEDESPEHFAGDAQTDQFTNDNDYNKNLDLRMTSPAGGTFMHPMHDATLDNYENELDYQVNQPDDEKE